ncbi:SPOR domain-containing protein [Halobacillus salinarum]|uniref:SPOR domain-containing protein n=1 Tax=Halobacillus salinarum TaxID=2932257 RepID=A0ABY4EQ83_9BACI|nr:SPOR domain-containing protein [Halobacillus salinarum]UOQ46246.1 SPOR domain-containing protein [Halobacillus salinarum]
MNSKKKISITFGTKAREFQNEMVQAKEEHAASADHRENDSFQESRDRPSIYELPFKRKTLTNSSLKPIIMSTLTALLISLGLGFLLLRMFVSISDSASSAESSPSAEEANAAAVSQDDTSAASLASETIDSYIVQAGVFSTEDKAKEWKDKLTNASIASMIWEREGKYFLFAGRGDTREEADQVAKALISKSVDTYVKPWQVTTKSYSGKEARAVESLLGYLKEGSLASVSQNGKEQIVKDLQGSKDSKLLGAVESWEADSGQNQMAWLEIVHSLEKE